MQQFIPLLIGLFFCSSIIAFPLLDDYNINDDKAKMYIEKYMHIAVLEMDRVGIPASIKMAQGILESGVGESELATVANNHFGIKCGGEVWTGSSHYVWDDEIVKSCFRVYGSVEESYVAHSDFLLNPAKAFRYASLFELDRRDYKGWANGLQKSGYATSKTYSKNLISIIERLELYKLDYLTVELLAVVEGALVDIFPPAESEVIRKEEDTTTVVMRVKDPFSASMDSIDMVLTLYTFTVNGIDAVYVQHNDDINSIANRYRKNPKKLWKFNELKGRTLKVGQYIFLDGKKNYFENTNAQKITQVHIVNKGQTMYDIAQFYGIKLNKLYSYNKVYKKQEPNPGVQVFLRKQNN